MAPDLHWGTHTRGGGVCAAHLGGSLAAWGSHNTHKHRLSSWDAYSAISAGVMSAEATGGSGESTPRSVPTRTRPGSSYQPSPHLGRCSPHVAVTSPPPV